MKKLVILSFILLINTLIAQDNITNEHYNSNETFEHYNSNGTFNNYELDNTINTEQEFNLTYEMEKAFNNSNGRYSNYTDLPPSSPIDSISQDEIEHNNTADYKDRLQWEEQVSNFSFSNFVTLRIESGEGETLYEEITEPTIMRFAFMVNHPTKKIERMMTSLFRALQVKGITFNDDLVYMDPDCPAKMNNSLLETGINEISPYNKKIYYSFKERSRKGEYAPVEVIDDPIQRFIVKAIDDIQMNTIICEYTGEVTLLRKKIFDKNDSIMELIRTPSSNTSLVICPENYGNLARFLSGVNNYDSKLKRKQNVYSIRLSIDGTVHILLLALRNKNKRKVYTYARRKNGKRKN